MKILQTANEQLKIDEYGRVISFRCLNAPDQEFIADGCFPAFMLQYRNENSFFELEPDEHTIVKTQETATSLTCIYYNVGGTGIDVTTVSAIINDTLSFTASIHNPDHLAVTGLAYPMIITRYALGAEDASEALLYPRNAGILYRNPKPQSFEPDSFHAWRFTPENGDTFHYPGQIFAQFLAYYNSVAGIYVACDDTTGQLKLIKPVHRNGLRLGFFHADDWSQSRDLGYHILLKSFIGDWYRAADLYREWTGSQHWSIPLSERKELPKWLLDSPPHIVLRIQGRLDEGPTEPNECFQPYEKAIPLLDKISEELDAPIAPIIMSWENKGPWVYPDCFPPAGTDESLCRFTKLVGQRGWHVGSYCNGTRWVTAHYWSGYNGRNYFEENNGAQTVCRTIDNMMWKECWDTSWRESYAACLGVERTREIAEDFCRHLMNDGLDYIQFLDQNVGCTAFPCYSSNHNHPPMPGHWMTQAMERLGSTFEKIRKESGRKMVFALEQPCCEFFIPYIQICDVRVGPPGHSYYNSGFVPLAMYLFHEYILFQGAFGCGQEPYHLQIRTAANLVWGVIPGGVLTQDGDLVNRDHPMPWSEWEPKLGDNDQSITMIKHATALRRGSGRPYLVYGRMQPPASIEDIYICQWQHGNENHVTPAVFHSAWKSPQGKFAVVLANWTDHPQTVTIRDSRLGKPCTVTIAPLDCALVEEKAQN